MLRGRYHRQLHRRICSKGQALGFVMHVNTTRSGKTAPTIPMTTPGLKMWRKMRSRKDKPVIQIYGNVVQKNADLAEAKAAAAAIAAIAQQYCAPV